MSGLGIINGRQLAMPFTSFRSVSLTLVTSRSRALLRARVCDQGNLLLCNIIVGWRLHNDAKAGT
jgi:hypothetical protein